MEDQNTKKGVVTDCLWTFLYEHPDFNSSIIGSLCLLDEVEILQKDFPKDWLFYAVTTSIGRTGYCLKRCIAVKED